MHHNLGERVRFTLRKPGGARRSFNIMRDTVYPDGRRIQLPVKDERIDAVNKMLKAGLKDATSAEIELKAVIAGYRKQLEKLIRAPSYCEANMKLVNAYWKHEYSHRQLVDVASAHNRLYRGVKALAEKSLLTIERGDLQRLINTTYRGNKHREVVAVLNQLLKFAGRGFELQPAKKERRTVCYLKADEMHLVLAKCPEPYKSFFGACFATGGRTGEVFGLTPASIGERSVYIDRQLTRDVMEGDTKNRRARHAPLIPAFRKYVDAWASHEAKGTLRNDRLADILADACTKAGIKAVTVHDLRHSYAIYLLGRGVNISLVAQSLANSVAVCQEYYAGFVLTAENVEAVASKL